jgi:hypothetical protein
MLRPVKYTKDPPVARFGFAESRLVPLIATAVGLGTAETSHQPLKV